ncbi:MAG: hypothetical protein HOQ00_02195, partial [Agromyces sp.]|nr:hypothetical protein [Agromyces sp.]
MMTTPSTTHFAPTTDRTALTGPAARDERRLLLCGVLVGATYLIGLAFISVFFATSHPPMD